MFCPELVGFSLDTARHPPAVMPDTATVYCWYGGALRESVTRATAIGKATAISTTRGIAIEWTRNNIHLNNVVWLLGQRRGRWSNVKTALFQCIVFFGNRQGNSSISNKGTDSTNIPAAREPLCWASVVNGGPTLNQHWVNCLCYLRHWLCWFNPYSSWINFRRHNLTSVDV